MPSIFKFYTALLVLLPSLLLTAVAAEQAQPTSKPTATLSVNQNEQPLLYQQLLQMQLEQQSQRQTIEQIKAQLPRIDENYNSLKENLNMRLNDHTQNITYDQNFYSILITALFIVMGLVSFFFSREKSKEDLQKWVDKEGNHLLKGRVEEKIQNHLDSDQFKDHIKNIIENSEKIEAILSKTIENYTQEDIEQLELKQSNLSTIERAYLEVIEAFKKEDYDLSLIKSSEIISQLSDPSNAERNLHSNQNLLAKALFAKGLILWNQKQPDEAIKIYDQIINTFSDSDRPEIQELVARALVNKGFSLKRQDQADEAIKIYDQIINTFSGSDRPEIQLPIAKALINKGVVLGEKAQFDEAIKIYDQIINTFSNSDRPEIQEVVVEAHYNLSCSYSMKRNEEKAKKHLRLSLELGYKDCEHIQQDSELDFVRGKEWFKELMEKYCSSK